jgi:predicted ferric reductase
MVDLFHTTADWSEEATGKLAKDAKAAGVSLHVLHDPRDGLVTGERIRAAVPGWKGASVWFCGPSEFGSALRDDFARHRVSSGQALPPGALRAAMIRVLRKALEAAGNAEIGASTAGS